MSVRRHGTILRRPGHPVRYSQHILGIRHRSSEGPTSLSLAIDFVLIGFLGRIFLVHLNQLTVAYYFIHIAQRFCRTTAVGIVNSYAEGRKLSRESSPRYQLSVQFCLFRTQISEEYMAHLRSYIFLFVMWPIRLLVVLNVDVSTINVIMRPLMCSSRCYAGFSIWTKAHINALRRSGTPNVTHEFRFPFSRLERTSNSSSPCCSLLERLDFRQDRLL